MAVGGNHDHNNLPCILAGSCGGAIRTGRYVKNPNGTANNKLLLALAQAMDVDLSKNPFGDPNYQGVLPNILA
jgi:hypothetical protein